MAKRQEVEVISRGSIPDRAIDAERKRAWRFVVVIIIAGIVVSVSIWGIFTYLLDDEEPPVTPEPLEAIITMGRDITNVGEPLYFSGAESTGEITSYRWDFDADIDSDFDTNPRNDPDAWGANVSHVYNEEGDYRVTLWVFSDDDNSKTFVMVHVGYYVNMTGQSVSYAQSKEYHFEVKDVIDANRVHIKIQYDSGSLGTNNITVYVRDSNNTSVDDSSGDARETGATQVEELDITDKYLAGHKSGTWTAEVRCITGGLLQPIQFYILIEVYY